MSHSPPPHEPYILPETKLREFSVRAMVTGTLLGVVFGASSLYLALKVGLTVSASIPVAVISLALWRSLSKLGLPDVTILEHNISQTAGSAGESIAFGVGVTMPAIMILGFDLEITRVLLVAVLGALLGILMMIPLRRALIVKEHGTLKYPEGTACAAVLTAGASESDQAHASPSAQAEIAAARRAGLGASPGGKVIFAGFLIGLAYKVGNIALRGWRDVPEKVFKEPFRAASVSVEISPELLGVGYIIGPRIAALMCGGGVLAYLVLIPMIKFFGSAIPGPLSPGTIPISQMGPGQIRSAYVLYIGAGAVAAGGIISLFRSMPTIWSGLQAGLKDIGFSRGDPAASGDTPRTDRDLSMKFVGIGIIVLLAGIVLAPSLHMNFLGALLIVIFGFLFVTVSSRLTGEIGSSSNPISGMTVATLLLTCLIFLIIGWTGNGYYVTALSVGAIVCIASSNGGSTSQDLKTGFLIGSTPKYQQIAILIGAFASALTMGPILQVLNNSSTVYVPIAQVVPAGLHADVAALGAQRETLPTSGPQSGIDPKSYRVWHKTDLEGGPEGKYLVDDQGKAVWFIDPGINGTFHRGPGMTSDVLKFDAPKATLISYIIKGILSSKLPWALVLLGVMIAVTLELCGVPSLAFAVGVYLPLSSSSPIWIGGLIRWMVDWHHRRKLTRRGVELTEEQHIAEGDKSPGVLMASGYIAGGAIAGILIAFLAGVLARADGRLDAWATAHNPFYHGLHADLLSLLPYAVLCGLLYLAGRSMILKTKTDE